MKRNIRRIKNVLKDPNKKSLAIIIKEVLQLWIIKKDFPLYYFGRFFYRKGAQDPKKFMSFKEYNTIVKHLVFENEKTLDLSLILDDKLEFYKHCKANNIPTAKVISYNRKTLFYYNNQEFKIHSAKSLQNFINKIYNETNLDGLFLKPFDANGGKGALKITNNTFDIDNLWNTLKYRSYIHQEVVQQHPHINKIYSKSINTLRVETFISKENAFHFLGVYMRFGAGNSIVDNTSGGGFFVDIKDGKLCQYGRTNLIGGGKIIDTHPDTNYPIENFEIPFFHDALDLVKKAAYNIPTYIQAWDVAITPTGPILIEGNNYPSLTTGEYSYNGYKNKPEVFKELLEPRQ